MKWLENKTDPVEKWLGEALDAARARTGDEVARRRVWARIEDLHNTGEVPVRRSRSFILPVVTGTLVAAGVVALLWLVPRPGSLAQNPPEPAAVHNPDPSPVASAESIPAETKPIRTGSRKARVTLPGGAAVDLDANSVLGWDAQRRPQVESGQARFEVDHQAPGNRFAVAAGPYLISVVGTKFRVSVAEARVSVEVEEGIVEVSRGERKVRLTEGDSWAGPVRGPAPSAAEHRSSVGRIGARRPSQATSTPSVPVAAAPSFAPAPVASDPVMAPPLASSPASLAMAKSPVAGAAGNAELKEARAALSEGRSEDALDIFTHCAKGTGPAAENAAYEMGRVLRDRLHRPKAAIAAWNQYRTRFPHGLLRAETDLSIVETLASLGDNKTALAEAEAFLARYPRSERREEVSKLAARVRATTGP